MEFNCPWYSLLLFLPILVFFLMPKATQKEKSESKIFFPALDRLKTAFPETLQLSQKSNFYTLCFLYLSWIFLCLALMQPERVSSLKKINSEGYDLLVAVDVSMSMQAVDLSTNDKTITRLDATKDVVGKFVEKRQGDRIGLIAFGENAYLLVPLTNDVMSVSKLLEDTLPGMAGNATAIGDAIGLAVRTLREKNEGSRVLILLTDGEDNASSIAPMEAAKLAKQYGVKIYTIGIGKKGAVPFKTNFGFQMMNVSIDEKLLKEISEMTGGAYFSAVDKSGLESIYKQINLLEKTKSEEAIYLIRDPYYRYPLTLSAIFFLLSLFVPYPFKRVNA